VQTTQREIAGDLGIGPSTLVRRTCRSWDRQAVDPSAPASDFKSELKRLRRDNDIFPRERDILKKATAFSPVMKVDEIRAHRLGESGISHQSPVPCAGVSQSGYFAREVGRPAPANVATWCWWRMTGRPLLLSRHLWQPPNDEVSAIVTSLSAVAGSLMRDELL
jgi:transposase-like protein